MNSVTTAPLPLVAACHPRRLLTPVAIFNDGIDPNLKTPYAVTASLGFQRELPAGLQLEVDYFGRFGRRLLMLAADVSQAIDFTRPRIQRDLGPEPSQFWKRISRQGANGLPVGVRAKPAVLRESGWAPRLQHRGQPAWRRYGTSCTADHVYSANKSALQNGATGEIAAEAIPLPANVGSTPQFFRGCLDGK